MDHRQHRLRRGSHLDKTLDRAFNLLQGEDDTTRLSGLTLLKLILDSHARIRQDPDIIASCWNAVPSTFLDRLFQSQAQALNQDGQATATFGLAVAIVHAFIALLPRNRFREILPRDLSESGRDSWIKRLTCMMAGLAHSQPDVLLQILQILEVFSCGHRGAILLVDVQDWTPLLRLAQGNETARNVFQYTIATLALSATKNTLVPTAKISELLEYNMSILVPLFKDADNLDDLFTMLNELFAVLPHNFFTPSPTWLRQLTNLVHAYSNSRRQAEPDKFAYQIKILSARLLQAYPLTFPSLLFDQSSRQEGFSSAKPLSYLFIKLIIVDITSTIPSLQEMLNSPEYRKTASRLEACYVTLTFFIGFLVNSFKEDSDDDEDDVGGVTERIQRLSFSEAKTLLQLRAEICQVLSLTIEHLRDRFDASAGGAPSLHPSSRSAPPMGTGIPAAVPWDTYEGMTKDKLTGAQVRALSLWLREDDREDLRKEAGGITDVLLSLYRTKGGDLNYKDPVAIILEATCATSQGIHAFLTQGGWEILATDLGDMTTSRGDEYRHLGISIIRALLTVVHSEVAGPAKEGWMPAVKAVASMDIGDLTRGEFMLAMLGLGCDLLARAPPGLRKRYAKHAGRVLGKARALHEREGGEMKARYEEVMMALAEVVPPDAPK